MFHDKIYHLNKLKLSPLQDHLTYKHLSRYTNSEHLAALTKASKSGH